jgi:hypothetical protein
MIIACNEIHNGRAGGDTISRKKSVRRYTRVWRVKTNSRYDEASILLELNPLLPQSGQQHPVDQAAYCRDRSASNDLQSKYVWLVTCNYSTEFELNPNPLDDPALCTWRTEAFKKLYTKDRDGKPLLNTAGDPQPIEGEDERWVCYVRKNVASIPAWFTSYRKAINSDAVTIDGIAFAIKQGRIVNMEVGEYQQRNEIYFRVLSFGIARMEDGQTWDVPQLNAGYYQTDPLAVYGADVDNIPCTDGQGRPVTRPVLLDELGVQISAATLRSNPSAAVYNSPGIFPLKAFAHLPLS